MQSLQTRLCPLYITVFVCLMGIRDTVKNIFTLIHLIQVLLKLVSIPVTYSTVLLCLQDAAAVKTCSSYS